MELKNWLKHRPKEGEFCTIVYLYYNQKKKALRKAKQFVEYVEYNNECKEHLFKIDEGWCSSYLSLKLKHILHIKK